jgi:hypothetical protein
MLIYYTCELIVVGDPDLGSKCYPRTPIIWDGIKFVDITAKVKRNSF